MLNVIVDQNDLGGFLTQHPDVAKVAFTGSTATGKKVMASVAGTIKRLTLELGGNDAAIVLDDVNVKEVAAKIFQGAMVNSGQVCLAIKRVYVPDSLYEAMCAELAELAKATVVGDGLDASTQMGPIQNKAQFEKVKEFLEDARANGKIIAGGKALDRDGYFIQPTIVRDIPDQSRLVREEQFGPVLPVLKYSSLDDAIDRPTAPNMDWEEPSGAATPSAPSKWPRRWVRARSGSTSISTCRPTFPSAARSNQAWARKWVRKDWKSSRSPG